MGHPLRFLWSAQGTVQFLGRVHRAVFRDGNYILLAAMPKSGSTFLTRVLGKLTGYRRYYCASAFENIEQELYLPRVVDAYGRGVIVQQHFRANRPNLRILNSFSIRPVVSIRNIFDIVVSVRDHMNQERIDNLPAVYPSQTFRTFSPADQLDYIIDMIVPWYISHYVSWFEAERNGDIPFLWLRYEDLVADWTRGIKRLLDYFDISRTAAEIGLAVSEMRKQPRTHTRLNVGVPGRGEWGLTEEQRERIRRLVRHYPLVDFSPIGLGDPS